MTWPQANRADPPSSQNSRQNPGNYGGLTSGFEYLDQPRAMLAQHLLWLTRHTPRQNGLTE
jgi:hypothetical protein